MALMKHALLSWSWRHGGNAAPEYITGPASQVKTALLEQRCNTGLLKCAAISTGLVSLLEDMFWVQLACHWQRNRGEVVHHRAEVLFVHPRSWVALHSWNRLMKRNQTWFQYQPLRLRRIVLFKCSHGSSHRTHQKLTGWDFAVISGKRSSFYSFRTIYDSSICLFPDMGGRHSCRAVR